MTAALFNQSVWFRYVCCISRVLQSNCQGYYHLWDICIFTQQQYEVNKPREIKFFVDNCVFRIQLKSTKYSLRNNGIINSIQNI